MILRELLKSELELFEGWGDKTWELSIEKFRRSLIMNKADTDEADIGLLLDMLNEPEKLKQLKGEPMYRFLKVLLSIQIKGDRTFWEELDEIVTQFVLAALSNDDVDLMLKHVKVDELSPHLPKNIAAALKLRASKAERTPEQVKFDEDHDVYIFVGREKFIKGAGDNYRKTLEIENLYKVDRFDLADHQALKMMKLRATAQGGDSQVYKIELPKGTIPDKKGTHASELPDWLVSLIDDHKKRVTV